MTPTDKAVKEAIKNGHFLQEPANGEDLKYKIGDRVKFTNPYGVTFHNHTILGYVPSDHALYKYGKRYFIDTDCFWFPKTEESLTPAN